MHGTSTRRFFRQLRTTITFLQFLKFLQAKYPDSSSIPLSASLRDHTYISYADILALIIPPYSVCILIHCGFLYHIHV